MSNAEIMTDRMTQPLPIEAAEDERADEYALDHDLVAAVMESVDAGDRVGVLALIADLHVADLADLTEQIDAAHRRRFIELVWADIDQEILVEVEEGVRDEILSFLAPEKLAEAIKDLDSDDVVYLLEDLEEDTQRQVLEAMEPADRAAVTKSLAYPEDTAGRLMQSEVVKAPPSSISAWMRASDGSTVELVLLTHLGLSGSVMSIA